MIPRLSKYIYYSKVNIRDNGVLDASKKMTLEELEKSFLENNYIKATCEAQLFNCFAQKNPPITYVSVFCKICNYQNALPFHLMNVCEPDIASNLYLIENQENYFYTSISNEAKSYLYKTDYNVDWLFHAIPSNIFSISDSETQTTAVTAYEYDCPRCYWLNKTCKKLDYIYRFSFVIADSTRKFKLGPCLLENDVAFKCVGKINPQEFCLISKVHVCQRLKSLFNRSATLELEAFRHETCELVSEKEKVIYKIKSIKFAV